MLARRSVAGASAAAPAPATMMTATLARPTSTTETVGRVARGGLINLIGTGIGGCTGLLVTWLVARGLGPDHAGAFFTGTAAFTLAATTARLGTQTGLVYWPARLRARGEHRLLRACLRAGLTPVAVAATAVAAVAWFVAPALRPLAFFIPLAALSDAFLAATRGMAELRPTVLLDRILRPGLQLAGVGALVFVLGNSLDATAYTMAWAMPYLPVAALAAYALHRSLLPVDPVSGGEIGRAFWRFTAPRAVGSVAQSALQRLDVILVAALAGLPTAAIYAVATRFLVLGQLVNGALSQVVQPRLAERLAVGDQAGANQLYQAATGWLVLLTWPVPLLAICFAPVYMGLFGPSYASGATAVVVLASAMLVATGCGMVDVVLSMAGRTSWNLGNVALALGIQVGANFLLVPRYGVLGAAIALAAALVVNNVIPLLQVGLAYGLHPFGGGTLAAGCLAVAAFGVLPVSVAVFAGYRPATMFTALAVGVVGYAAGALALRRPLQLDKLAIKR